MNNDLIMNMRKTKLLEERNLEKDGQNKKNSQDLLEEFM